MAADVPERPLRDPLFDKRVAAMLLAAADGNSKGVAALLRDHQDLATACGPHPFWGGKPQPLHVAAECGHLDIVRQLLDAGADPNDAGKDYGEWSPLLLAINRGHQPVVELLLQRGAEPDIFAACAMGDADGVSAFLSEDSTQCQRAGPSSANPLHFATTVEIAKLLLKAGADPLAADVYGNTPVRSAASSDRRRDVAEFLLGVEGEEDVHLAAALGHLDRLKNLLAEDPTRLSQLTFQYDVVGDGGTPLHAAALCGQLDAARFLLDQKADVNAKALDGQTPLHCAAAKGHLEVARLLLDRGADPAIRDCQHDGTAKDWAEFQRKQEMVEFLAVRR